MVDAARAQQTADHVREGMYADDRASRMLGIEVTAMGPGSATLTMTVRADMLNSLKLCHGGLITTLADSAFAYACNSYNQMTVASSLAVDLVASGREGDILTAVAQEITLAGRTGVYDVAVTNQRGERIALMRGRSYRMKEKPTVPDRGTGT